MATFDLEKVWKACKFTLKEQKGGHKILCATGKVKDEAGKVHKIDKCVDLTQLILDIRFHLESAIEHVESTAYTSGEHVGGWLSDTYSKAVKIAKQIGENRIAQDIYNDILPVAAEWVPGGTTALRVVDKAHDVVVTARNGSKASVKKIKEIAVQAKADPGGAANQVLDLMKGMGRLMAMRQEYGEHVGARSWSGRLQSHDHRPKGSRTKPTGLPRPRSSQQPGTRDHRTQAPPQLPPGQDPYFVPPGQGGYPPGQDPYAGYGYQDPYAGYGYQDPYAGYGYGPPQYGPPQYGPPQYGPPQANPYQSFAEYLAQMQADQAKLDEEAYYESLFDPTSENYVRPSTEDVEGWNRHGQHVEREQVEGWLYNKPYRDPLTAIQHINRDPAFVHRYLYNRGMGRG